MSIVYADSPMTWDDVLRTWCELDVPEGWRPEFAIEGITLTPPPGGEHNLIAGWVNRQLLPAVPEGCELFQTQGVGVRLIGSIYVPDLCIAPRSAVPRGAEPVPAEDVLLVVEITSRGNAHHDRKKKKWAYAHGGIPQYLLIDAYDEDGASVSLFTDPVDGVYGKTTRVPFGQPIALGKPFGLDLRTDQF